MRQSPPPLSLSRYPPQMSTLPPQTGHLPGIRPVLPGLGKSRPISLIQVDFSSPLS
jgi:hypothetical protein